MERYLNDTATINRLKRIEGQVRGLIKMINKEKDCEEIMIQIISVQASLRKAGQVILEKHLHRCVLDGIRNGKEDETIKKVYSAVKYFSRAV